MSYLEDARADMRDYCNGFYTDDEIDEAVAEVVDRVRERVGIGEMVADKGTGEYRAYDDFYELIQNERLLDAISCEGLNDILERIDDRKQGELLSR